MRSFSVDLAIECTLEHRIKSLGKQLNIQLLCSLIHSAHHKTREVLIFFHDFGAVIVKLGDEVGVRLRIFYLMSEPRSTYIRHKRHLFKFSL